MAINIFFELEDEDNEEYRALRRAPNYDMIMKKLIDRKSPWKRSILNEVQSFLRTRLTKTTKS